MPFYSPARGFSFPKEIQPILDRHCIRCHNDSSLKMDARRIQNQTIREKDPVWKASYPESPFSIKLAAARAKSSPAITNNQRAFSLLGELVLDKVAKRSWEPRLT